MLPPSPSLSHQFYDCTFVISSTTGQFSVRTAEGSREYCNLQETFTPVSIEAKKALAQFFRFHVHWIEIWSQACAAILNCFVGRGRTFHVETQSIARDFRKLYASPVTCFQCDCRASWRRRYYLHHCKTQAFWPRACPRTPTSFSSRRLSTGCL